MKPLFVFWVLILPLAILGQGEADFASPTPNDTSYVEDMRKKVMVKALAINKFNSWFIRDGQSGKRLEFKANDNVNFGVGANWRWLGLSVAFGLGSTDDRLYGKTERWDFQINAFPKKMAMDFFLLYYKGFYLNNPQEINPNFNPQNKGYPKFPELASWNVGTSSLYIFNHRNFSYPAFWVNNFRQIKSNGSFMAGGYANWISLNSPTGAPPVLDSLAGLPPKLNVKGAENFTLGALGGYAHTFVVKRNFYWALNINLGAGAAYQIVKADVKNDHWMMSVRGAFRSSVGYNGPVWVASLSFSFDMNGVVNLNKNYAIANNFGFLKLHIGKRF